jgi:hypothetical protein
MDSLRAGQRDFLYHVSFISAIYLSSIQQCTCFAFYFHGQGHTEAKEETKVYVGQKKWLSDKKRERYGHYSMLREMVFGATLKL